MTRWPLNLQPAEIRFSLGEAACICACQRVLLQEQMLSCSEMSFLIFWYTG